MTKATTAAVSRPELPAGHGLPQPRSPGAIKMMMSWSIRGVPRMIQTKVLMSQASGWNRLMEPKEISSPRGRANSRVRPKSWQLIQKPSNRRPKMTLIQYTSKDTVWDRGLAPVPDDQIPWTGKSA